MATTTKKKRHATHITLPSGKRIYVSAKTKEELDAKVTQAKMEMGVGVDLGDNTLFKDLALMWVNVYKKPKLRISSYLSVERMLLTYILPFFGDMKVRDVKPMHIQLFMGTIQHLSRSSQTKCLQYVSAILRTAVDNGLIFKSPVTSRDKASGPPAKKIEPLTRDQARALLEAVKGTRAYTFCFLALSTGMRRSEIVGLMWEDIDFERGFLTVQHSKVFPGNRDLAPVTTLLKTEAGHRVIPLFPELLAYLEEERKRSNSPYVMSMENGESLSSASFRSMWKLIEARTATEDRPLGTVVKGSKYGDYAISLDFNCHPHQLRHTCITQWVESGMDFKEVQYLAGHSSLNMTLKVYAHYRQSSRAAETALRVGNANAYLVN